MEAALGLTSTPARRVFAKAVVVSRGGSELFRLSRRGTWGADGQKPWEVRWSGGAEPAAVELPA